VKKTGRPFEIRKAPLVFGRPVIQEEEIDEVVDTLRSGWIGPGPKVEKLEAMFKDYTGAKYALALESGTVSLFLSMLIAGIGHGDEVITTPMTYCATANAIIHTGATPVFADIDRDTLTIDPERIEEKISAKTKAIIPVHLHGRPSMMEDISKIGRRHDLIILEDAAHCLEGVYGDRKIGNIGDITCFSFNANKNIITGKGGMITTNVKDWAKKLKLYRDNGQKSSAWERFSENSNVPYEVIAPGFNYSMTDIQASLGIHQMNRVGRQLARREEVWRKYDEILADLPVTLPNPPEKHMVHARHLYALLIDPEKSNLSRDELRRRLHELKVGTGVHYVSLHLHEYYRNRFLLKPEDYPNAKYISEKTVSVPLSSGLTDEDVEYVIKALRAVLS